MIALDLDGTLLDCRTRQCAVLQAVLPSRVDPAAWWARKRGGATTAAALVALGVDRRRAEAAAAAWTARVEDDEWLALDAPLPGARAALARAGFVLTARRRPGAVARQLQALGLAAEVVVVDPRRAAEAKAEVLRDRGARGLVGDTESDARAAALAGVGFAAVGTGQRDPAFLLAHGAGRVHEGVLDAVAALRG